MASISCRHVKKVYPGNVVAVPDFSLEIADKEFIVFVGPSGCGKSTTLRMIAGLEEISKGEMYIGGRLINDVPPKDRDIAMVFQSYALYPNMTVYENMAFARRVTNINSKTIKNRVPFALSLVGLEDKMDRLPDELSGGEQQRVAVARALAHGPKLIIADEPTGNLDEDTAQDITEILKESAHKMNKCVVVVTHSNELAKQADVVFRLKKGELQVLERVQDGAAQSQSRRNNAPRSERRAH